MAADSSSAVAADFAIPSHKRPKSPPLAFAKTSNDSLLPLVPPSGFSAFSPSHQSNSIASPNRSTMGRLDPPSPADAFGLQVVVDQQNMAIQLLHDAFAAERQSWILERESLHQRIAALERLLRSGDHHSPAKSPVLSPLSRPVMAPQLPSIAEHEKPEPLSRRRSAAPTSIELPPQEITSRRRSSVAFAPDQTADIQVETIPSRPSDAGKLSPPPLSFRRDAGHTPLHSVRPPTPPPKDSLSMAAIEDTPTRRNTHINTLLTQRNDEDSDKSLSGPLNLPELPSKPADTNFTLEMLSRKLELIEQHPEEEGSRPLVFAQPSPGLASPTEKPDYISARIGDEETPSAPNPTRTAESMSDRASSKALSPGAVPNALSPTLTNGTNANTIGAPLSPQSSRERQVQQQFEQGGIKLKKRPSVNFGAPFGTLGGFGGPRRQS